MPIEVEKQVDALGAMAEAIRTRTIKLLNNATDDELLWSPPGLSNHLLWHAGHSLWVQDILCIEAATGQSELPAGWHEAFRMGCDPASRTGRWPGRNEVTEQLERQIERIVSVIAGLSHEDLTGPPRTLNLPDAEPLRYWIIHGLQDEANHQGEMHLLLKMQRARP